jgi:hypothetical protein
MFHTTLIHLPQAWSSKGVMGFRREFPNVSPQTFCWCERGPLLVKRGKHVVRKKWYVLVSIIAHSGPSLGFTGLTRDP